jgi:hypothetical protein
VEDFLHFLDGDGLGFGVEGPTNDEPDPDGPDIDDKDILFL